METMLPLPNEILGLVHEYFDIQYLDTGSPRFREIAWKSHRTLLSLSATSHQLRSIAKPILKRTWWFGKHDINNRHDVIDFVDATARRQAIRHVFLDATDMSCPMMGPASTAPNLKLIRGPNNKLCEDFAMTMAERPELFDYAERLSRNVEGGSSGWWYDLGVGRQGAYMALLLSLIPNLQFLHLTCGFGPLGYSSPVGTLCSFLEMQSGNAEILPNLNEIMIDGPLPPTRLRGVLSRTKEALLGMPTVRTLRLRPAHVLIQCAEDEWRAMLGENIRDLDLENSYMTTAMMTKISTHMVNLTHFRFTWKLNYCDDPADADARAPFGPRSMIRALQSRGDTLKSLILDARHHELELFLPVASFHGLHKLEYLEITPTLLVGADMARAQQNNLFNAQEANAVPAQQEDLDANFLPASLKKFVLHDPGVGKYEKSTLWLVELMERWQPVAPGVPLLDISQWHISAALCRSAGHIPFALKRNRALKENIRLPRWFTEVYK